MDLPSSLKKRAVSTPILHNVTAKATAVRVCQIKRVAGSAAFICRAGSGKTATVCAWYESMPQHYKSWADSSALQYVREERDKSFPSRARLIYGIVLMDAPTRVGRELIPNTFGGPWIPESVAESDDPANLIYVTNVTRALKFCTPLDVSNETTHTNRYWGRDEIASLFVTFSDRPCVECCNGRERTVKTLQHVIDEWELNQFKYVSLRPCSTVAKLLLNNRLHALVSVMSIPKRQLFCDEEFNTLSSPRHLQFRIFCDEEFDQFHSFSRSSRK